VTFQQTDYRQWDQQDKRQVAGVKKTFTQFLENSGDRHMRRQSRDDPGNNNHQYRVKT
jgi:hypothetical protein